MKIELASKNEIDEIYDLIIARCLWFKEHSIKQWDVNIYPKLFNKKYFLKQMETDKLFVLKKDKIAGVVLLKDKDGYWPDLENAYYVHHLATSPDYKGLGIELLNFALEQAKKDNKDYLRLDCLRDNQKLNQYYESLGFKNVGSGESIGYPYNLWEMEVEKENKTEQENKKLH